MKIFWSLWALKWALRCVRSSGIFIPSPNSLAVIVSEISAFIRTDGHGLIDLASNPDQEYIYCMGSLPSACYILSDETSIPFYSTSKAQEVTRKNAIVEYLDLPDTRYSAEYLDYQIPVTQLQGPKWNGDMQATKRDWNAPPTGGIQI